MHVTCFLLFLLLSRNDGSLIFRNVAQLESCTTLFSLLCVGFTCQLEQWAPDEITESVWFNFPWLKFRPYKWSSRRITRCILKILLFRVFIASTYNLLRFSKFTSNKYPRLLLLSSLRRYWEICPTWCERNLSYIECVAAKCKTTTFDGNWLIWKTRWDQIDKIHAGHEIVKRVDKILLRFIATRWEQKTNI